jgi:pimeloyl-ACP methyl ester carboxylesterase
MVDLNGALSRMNLNDWRVLGQHIRIDDHDIFAVDYGNPDGTPVLVLHGFPTASYDYARLVPLLADQYRLILFDFLGYGFSDKPYPYTYSLFEQADIAQGVAEHFGMARGYLLSHDMGDSVALEMLRQGQLVVDKYVMLNGSVLLKHYRPVLAQRLLLNPLLGPLVTRFGLIGRDSFGKQFASLFDSPPPPEEIDAFWSLIEHNDGARVYHELIKYIHEREEHEDEWLDALAEHSAPLTVIWGMRDPVSVPAIAEAVIERRPDGQLIRLPAVGHYPQWEAPKVVAAAIHNAWE